MTWLADAGEYAVGLAMANNTQQQGTARTAVGERCGTGGGWCGLGVGTK